MTNTLLETVKQRISSLPAKSFKAFYKAYLYEMQDRAIDQEMNYLVNYNQLDILSLDRLIQDYVSKMVIER